MRLNWLAGTKTNLLYSINVRQEIYEGSDNRGFR